jgi:quinol monooxygenase YgiN
VEELLMERFAVLAILEAKVGMEQAVEELLTSALSRVGSETGTVSWYALRFGPSTFGIFDTFTDQGGREAHLSGAVAEALLARAADLFVSTPMIEQPEILAVTSRR